jgi:hypothetical protein
MKAATILFWKEIRENAKWAATGALAMAVGMVYAVYHAVDAKHELGVYGLDLDTVWNGINEVVAFAAPIIGGALGFLQIMPEQSRDRWAFFMHRPASRLALFAGKISAGIALFLAATIVPFTAIVLWIRVPGHVAGPFEWAMAEAGFASIAIGIMFYFAGLLVGLRRARWYGSRLMPFAAVIAGAFLVTGGVDEFWQALATAGLFSALLGLAAWQAFRTEAGDHAGGFGGLFSLGLTLASGIAVTGLIIIAVLANSGQMLHLLRPVAFWYSAPQMTEDGQAVRIDELVDKPILVLDANGRPVGMSPEQWVASHPRMNMNDIESPWTVVHRPRYNDMSRYAKEITYTSFGNTGQSVTWYLFHNLILLYSDRDGTLIGSVGEEGFRQAHTIDEATQSDPFTLNKNAIVNETTVVADEDAIYSVEGWSGNVRVSPILIGAAARQVQFIGTAGCNTSGHNAVELIASTAGSFYIFGDGRRLLYTVPRTHDFRTYNSVSAGVFGHGRLLICYQRGEGGSSPTNPAYVEVYDKTGKLVRAYTVAPVPPRLWNNPTTSNRLEGILVGTVVPATITVPTAIDMLVQSDARSLRVCLMVLNATPGCIPLLIGSAIGGILFALVTWRIARRCAFGRGLTWAWVVGNVFLSWTGVLVLIALRPIPALEICQSCGKPRVVTRETCEHCGASWPTVKRDGTEIFDEPAKLVRVAI